jgi:hypothetical protein
MNQGCLENELSKQADLAPDCSNSRMQTVHKHKRDEVCTSERQETDSAEAATELNWGLTEVDQFSSPIGWRRLLAEAGLHDTKPDWGVDGDDADIKSYESGNALLSLARTIRYVSGDWERLDPGQRAEWRAWGNSMCDLLDRLSGPPAETLPVQAMAAIAENVASSYLDTLAILASLVEQHANAQFQVERLAKQVAQLEDEVAGLRRDNSAFEEAPRSLTAAKRPQCSRVAIPSEVIVVRSRVQQEIIRQIAEEGMGRSWRIISDITSSGIARERSVGNAVTRLTKKGLIGDYRCDGRAIRWKPATGGSRRLIMLTHRGAEWYRQAYGEEPVESEIIWAARMHRSAVHGVGVLEARDHLRAAGYEVDDDPGPILEYQDREWSRRVEPDLMLQMDGEDWAVEVQREVAQRQRDKWTKVLALSGRLVLILFNVAHREKQQRLLRHAQRLPRGTIYLASLEEMETGEWDWSIIRSPIRP